MDACRSSEPGRSLFGDRLSIEFERNREEDGVESPVMDVMQSTNSVRQGVADSKSFLEPDPGHHGGHQCLGSAFDISRVFHDSREMPGYQLKSSQRDGLHERVLSGRQKFFDRMAEGVHAATCRQERWET